MQSLKSRLWLFPEVEAEHILECSVGVGQTKLVLAVVVGVQLKDKSAEDFRVVPEKRQAEVEIGGEVVEYGMFFLLRLGDVRTPVAYVWHDRCSQEHVASEHTVVVVAYADAVVMVVYVVE